MSKNVSLTNGDHLKLAIYHLEQLSAPDPDCDDITLLLWSNILNICHWLGMFYTWCTKKKK